MTNLLNKEEDIKKVIKIKKTDKLLKRLTPISSIKKENDMTIIDKKDNFCEEHDFSSSSFVIINESIDNIYCEVVYIVCRKCGQIRRQELPIT